MPLPRPHAVFYTEGIHLDIRDICNDRLHYKKGRIFLFLWVIKDEAISTCFQYVVCFTAKSWATFPLIFCFFFFKVSSSCFWQILSSFKRCYWLLFCYLGSLFHLFVKKTSAILLSWTYLVLFFKILYG